jgi:hypothetical protein
MCTHTVELCIGIMVYFSCAYFAGDTSNFYTQNHLKYNQLVSLTLIKWDIAIIACILFKDNLAGGRCFKIVFDFLFCLIRVMLLTLMVVFVIPKVLKCLYETWILNSKNWWLNENESFFTNESKWNALVTWIMWAIILLIEYFFLIYVAILLILALAMIKESGMRCFSMFAA